MHDTLVVWNFWATWCKPCVEELPFFEQVNSESLNQPVKIILVNLDFNKDVVSSVLPFIQKKKIQAQVIHITDTDANAWINRADSHWSGAIPATIMMKNGEKVFFREGSMNYSELKAVISDKSN